MGQPSSKGKDGKGNEAPVIDLQNKSLDKFIAEAKKAGLKHIERLDLSRQELAELPPEISKLVSLKVLTCYGNSMKSIPPELGKLENLTALGLNENSLTQIPKELGNLKNLTMLDLRYNRLTAIPDEIGNLI